MYHRSKGLLKWEPKVLESRMAPDILEWPSRAFGDGWSRSSSDCCPATEVARSKRSGAPKPACLWSFRLGPSQSCPSLGPVSMLGAAFQSSGGHRSSSGSDCSLIFQHPGPGADLSLIPSRLKMPLQPGNFPRYISDFSLLYEGKFPPPHVEGNFTLYLW